MVARPGLQMHCDGRGPRGCNRWVTQAPRIVIPHDLGGMPLPTGRPPRRSAYFTPLRQDNTPEQVPWWTPIRILTHVHLCDLHGDAFDVQDYLSQGGKKAHIEAEARRLRGADFKPAFDHAYVELVLVTTPEYRAFMRRVMQEALRAAE